jgi:hypothetical protein
VLSVNRSFLGVTRVASRCCVLNAQGALEYGSLVPLFNRFQPGFNRASLLAEAVALVLPAIGRGGVFSPFPKILKLNFCGLPGMLLIIKDRFSDTGTYLECN